MHFILNKSITFLLIFIIVTFLTIVKNKTIYYAHPTNIQEVASVIEYSPFWKTLKNSKETTYTLINHHHISSATINKLRKNKPMNTTTINDLCRILDCNVADILNYVPSDTDQPL